MGLLLGLDTFVPAQTWGGIFSIRVSTRLYFGTVPTIGMFAGGEYLRRRVGPGTGLHRRIASAPQANPLLATTAIHLLSIGWDINSLICETATHLSFFRSNLCFDPEMYRIHSEFGH